MKTFEQYYIEESYELALEASGVKFKSDLGDYNGPDLESGGTSIAGSHAKPIATIIEPTLNEGDTILDYGAGKFARNADYLRKKGYEVYAYDPFNGQANVNGWDTGSVSNKLPPKSAKFDVAFTSYVLNVVKVAVEKGVIDELTKRSKKQFHIVRNDIVSELNKGTQNKSRGLLIEFIKKYYKNKEVLKLLTTEQPLSKEQLTDLAMFGYQSSRGFQRLPMLERHGLTIAGKSGGWKVYTK